MSECIGTRWRYRQNNFINANGEIISQARVRELKSRSCNGKCQPQNYSCHSDFDHHYINEYVCEVGNIPSLPKGVVDGDELVLRLSWDGDCIDDIWFEKVNI